MSKTVRTLALGGLVLAGLSACVSVPRGQGSGAAVVDHVSDSARQAEAARQAWLQAHPHWSFQGRVAISKDRNGGSGRIDLLSKYEVGLVSQDTQGQDVT